MTLNLMACGGGSAECFADGTYADAAVHANFMCGVHTSLAPIAALPLCELECRFQFHRHSL